jgi:ERCC4-type nuclease
MVTILIDDRERDVAPYFSQYLIGERRYAYEIRRLTVGDYVVMYEGEILMIIERKSINDLCATFTDQSRRFNYLKMLEEAKVHPRCKVFYLIEGSKRNTNIPWRTLMTHLNHLLFNHGIITIYSKSQEHSAEVIVNLTYDYCTSESFMISGGGVEHQAKTIESITTVKATPARAIYHAMWHSIEGCTDTAVAGLIDHGITFQHLLLEMITEDHISGIRRPSGATIGSKQVKKIIASAKQNKTHIKLLGCVNGVSEPRAKAILSQFSMKDLILTVTPTQLSEVKINGRRLGELIATRLLNALRTTSAEQSQEQEQTKEEQEQTKEEQE